MTADAPDTPAAEQDDTAQPDATADHPYADIDDAELATLLAAALADRIDVATLTERAAHAHAGNTAGESSGGPAGSAGFGVQMESDWRDYPAWEDCDDWEAGPGGQDMPLRFATVEAAETWWQVQAEQEYRVQHRRWRTAHERWLPRRDRYVRRVQALKDAGLWTQEGERTSPLLYPAGPGHEPRRGTGTASRYRVVADAEMGTPLREWSLHLR